LPGKRLVISPAAAPVAYGLRGGVILWHNRVAYAIVLVTDRYLPFRLALSPRARQRG
jgi:hypothetical protein